MGRYKILIWYTPAFILWFLLFLISLQHCIRPDEESFYINQGFDFANGRNVTSKVSADPKGKVIWTKYHDADKSMLEIYKKYGLGYEKPLITYSCGKGYIFSWFNIIRIPQSRPWWKFWRHDYYILRYRPTVCWDGISGHAQFFQIIKKFSPPKEEVRQIYDGCIAHNRDFKTLTGYLQERYDHYNVPHTKKIISEIFKSGDGKIVFSDGCYERPGEIARYILKYRDQYPRQLPDHFLALACAPQWDTGYLDKDGNSFMMLEYFYNPGKKNALYLALSMTNGKYGFSLSREFLALSKKKLLKTFISQVMPEDSSVLPSLPDPTPVPANPGRALDIYYVDTYLNLPERETALQMTFNFKYLRKYWQKALDDIKK